MLPNQPLGMQLLHEFLTALPVFGPVLIIFPTLSFFLAARMLGIRAGLARVAATGCAAAIASLALELAGLWRPLRESRAGLSHRVLVNWMTMLLGAWVPASIAIWKLMAVEFTRAAACAAVAALLYVAMCVGPYLLLHYWLG